MDVQSWKEAILIVRDAQDYWLLIDKDENAKMIAAAEQCAWMLAEVQ